MPTLRFILFTLLMVLSIKSRLYSSSFVYGIVNGSLDNWWGVNLTIFASQFTGLISAGIDSKYNYFRIYEHDDNIVKLRFNYEFREVSLSTFCGCSPCRHMRMVLHIRSRKSAVDISCNQRTPLSILRGPGPGYPRQLIPMDMANVRDSIYVMVGNIGPYTNIDNIILSPSAYQMIGCVDSFYYNDALVSLLTVGDKVQPWCTTMCSEDPCNGGVCRQISRDSVTCDCSNVGLNGRYCDNALRVYHRGKDTSFNLKKDVSWIYMKMTWRTLKSRRYCLVEIIDESNEYNYLLLDSSSLNNNYYDNNNLLTNVIIINITNTYSHFRINNRTSKIDFTFSRHMRINIGFSERKNSCAVLEGAYDLLYENLRIIPDRMTSTSPDWAMIFKIMVMVMMIIVIILVCSLFFIKIKGRKICKKKNVIKDNVAMSVRFINSNVSSDRPELLLALIEEDIIDTNDNAPKIQRMEDGITQDDTVTTELSIRDSVCSQYDNIENAVPDIHEYVPIIRPHNQEDIKDTYDNVPMIQVDIACNLDYRSGMNHNTDTEDHFQMGDHIDTTYDQAEDPT